MEKNSILVLNNYFSISGDYKNNNYHQKVVVVPQLPKTATKRVYFLSIFAPPLNLAPPNPFEFLCTPLCHKNLLRFLV